MLGTIAKPCRQAIVILSVPVVCFSLATATHAQELRIATEGYYAPFNYVDDSGALAGFDIDIANALCTVMEVTCTFVQNDWDALIPGLIANDYDVIVASMSITPERQEQVAFSLPYYSNMLSFVGRRDSGLEISEAALNGKTIGAQRSTVSSEYLETTYADIVTIQLYDSQDQALSDLMNGTLDLVLSDNLPTYAWLQSEAGSGYEFIGEFIDINDRIAIAARKTEGDLINNLNDALIEIIENGAYQEVNAKYFPFSIYF